MARPRSKGLPSALVLIIPVLVLVCAFLVTIVSGGISFKLPIPLISFYNPLEKLQQHQHHRPHPHHHEPHHAPSHHSHSRPIHYHTKDPRCPQNHGQESTSQYLKHHDVTGHSHQDDRATTYLHDPDSTVKFYYKENLVGPSNRVDIHHDGCREVPKDYWYQRPKSLWAKHCVTLFQNGHCKGEGVQVAGMVNQFSYAGMHYGVNSFKPCEKNIRIRFMPAKKHHHHQPHQHNHHHN